ncbi:hypothetical protein LIER_27668 [Lithospermum erythrorhizon]|uniref:Helitron helicase-like domain-containing protein n=1 Tax=Lithospermum erythrorhizon TaxID=34254 RepID=A0AAV3RCU5_LITER
MHRRCGELNPENVCMRNGKCKNHYPKNFVDHTTHGKGVIQITFAEMINELQRAVKYLYKYVHKGHDKVMFRIASDNPGGSNVDEISNFQNALWVSPVEAAWIIYGFPLHGMYSTVLQLQVHLPNFQTVQFEDDADLQEILQDPRLKRTMLTEFFESMLQTPMQGS